MTPSQIPAVGQALYDLFSTALPAAEVFRGKWTTIPDGDYLTVGWTPDEERISGVQSWVGIGNTTREERIDVPCYIDSYSGDTDPFQRLTQTFAIEAICEGVVRSDPSLGGLITQGAAQIGAYAERIEETDAGVAVGVVFHVLVWTLLDN